MHPTVYSTFDELFERWPPPGPSVLELGAPGHTGQSLLTLLAKRNPGGEYTGLNMQRFRPRHRPYKLVEGNANDLSQFDDCSFDAVVTNAMFEHDRRFWLTVGEIRRVLRPGGLLYLGVPGYTRRRTRAQRAANRFLRRVRNSPLARYRPVRPALASARHIPWLASTSILRFHAVPDDFYRFSPSAVRKVLLEDMEVLELFPVMQPPRLIAVGRKPETEAPGAEASSGELPSSTIV